MPIHVKVVSQEDYTKWVEGKKKEMSAAADDPTKVWELPDLVARGEKVYSANCAVCHKPDGTGAGPIKPLAGSQVVLDADKVKEISDRAERPEQRRDAAVEASVRHRDCRRRYLHEEQLGQQDGPSRSAGRRRRGPQVNTLPERKPAP